MYFEIEDLIVTGLNLFVKIKSEIDDLADKLRHYMYYD